MDFKDYKNLEEYPKKPVKPILKPHPTLEELDEYKKQYLKYNDAYRDYVWKIQRYRDASSQILENFKMDAFEELGITNNPKREKLYSKAWEFGHPSGLQEVFFYMEELTELIEGD
jgi:hypothetical protein